MIYHLYFESMERACNLKLYSDEQEESNDRISESKIFNTSGSDVELLKLNYKDLKLVTYTGTDDDKPVYIKTITADTVNPNIYHIYLTGIGKEQEQEFKQKYDHIRVKKDDRILTITDIGSNQPKTFTFIFHYVDDNRDFTGTFIAERIPDDHIYEIVLDFGSEASQMLIKRDTEIIVKKPSKLFNKCAEHFYNLEKIDDRQYDQQDNDDKKLFRSIFFRPQNEEEYFDIKHIIEKPGKNDHILNFITKRDDNNKGDRLPNIKISNLSGEKPEGVNLDNLHQGVVMRFIHEAVMEVEDTEKGLGSNGKCGIRLHLLVPNVMGQDELSTFLMAIRKYTNAKDFRELLPETMRDVVFDIHSFSESDAAFVSWLEDEQAVEAGNYLIIDVGKGTTDFSIINVRDKQNAVSIYRSGFIGAGNALSYAIFVNYIVSMGGARNAKAIIKKILNNAEEAQLYLLENIIEDYKKKTEQEKNYQEQKITIDESLEIGTIIDRIKKRGDIEDKSHIIEYTVYQIIRKIVVNIKETHFHKIILSGRAFKYKPFLDATRNILAQFYDMAEDNIIALNELKNSCLNGPLCKIKISKQSDIVAIPKALNAENTRSRKSKEKELNQKFDEILENITHRGLTLQTNKRWKWLDWQFILSKFPILRGFKELSHSARNGKGVYSTINLDADNSEIINLMRGKLDLKLDSYDANTLIYVSNDEYITEQGQSLNSNSRYMIFFDGKEFYIRDKKNCIELTPKSKRKDTDMLYESLFPYPYRILDEEYAIPVTKN